MNNKSEQTSLYILEKVGPIFNKKGYDGTSMTDITNATGLTKGAIYGNFKNKEELSILAFNYNIKMTIGRLSDELEHIDSSIAKLYSITNFFRRYYKTTNYYGGCPILNIGIDSNFNNSILLRRVKSVINKLENNFSNIITTGIINGEINKSIDSKQYAKLIFAMIEGSIFMSNIQNDDSYILNMSNHVDHIIKNEFCI